MNFLRDGLELEIDSAPRVFKTREGHVVEEYFCKGVKGFFVTIAGTHYCAHGKTLADAITDAEWKDESRRPKREDLVKKIRAAGVSRKISLLEFRLLTGACAEGCRIALERARLDGSPMTAHDIRKVFPDWGAKLLQILGWEK